MQHAEIREALGQRITALLGADNLPITLRPYQRETLEAARRWLADTENENRRAHVVHATGLGKSLIFSALVGIATGLRSLVVVPSKVLVEQTARFIARFSGGMIGHLSSLKRIYDERGEIIAVRGHDFQDIVVTTDESFVRYAWKLARDYKPDIIIWDECHWAYTPRARHALNHFPEAVIIGFSATPDYLSTAAKSGAVAVTLENGQVLYGMRDRFAEAHFGLRIDERTIRWGVEQGWLAELSWGRIEFDISLDHIPVAETPAGMDFSPRALEKHLAKYWSLVSETVRRLYIRGEYDLPKRQTYAVCPSVVAAYEIAGKVSDLGVPAACIVSATPDAERSAILAAYDAGEIRFLSSVMVLREGWDAPNAEVCLMLRPTKSRVLYLQSMGRAMRPDSKGMKTALVLDAHFQTRHFAPLSAPVLIAEPGSTVVCDGILLGKTGSEMRHVKDIVELPAYLQPRLVVVEALRTEHYAGEDGIFEADGKHWISIPALEEEFRAHESSLLVRLKKHAVPSREGRSRAGRSAFFYEIDKAREACRDLLHPRADKDGFARMDGEPWATRGRLIKHLGIADGTVRKCLKNGVRKRWGRGPGGKRAWLYSVSDAERASKAYRVPKVGAGGLISVQGQDYAQAHDVARIVGLGSGFEKTARRLLKEAAWVRTIRGKSRVGVRTTLYCVADVRIVWAKLIKDGARPHANRRGFIRTEKGLFAPLRVLGDYLQINPARIKERIDEGGCRTLEGRNRLGHSKTFYNLEDVRLLCDDLIAEAKRREKNRRRAHS